MILGALICNDCLANKKSRRKKQQLSVRLRRMFGLQLSQARPKVYKHFPLREAVEAHRLMESGKHIGKILLIP